MAKPKTKSKNATKTSAPKTTKRATAMPIVALPFDGPFEAYATGTDHLLARGHFKAGLRDGRWTGGSDDGQRRWVDTYVAGVSDGPAQEIIEGRGKQGLCGEGREHDGKRVGLWTLYEDDGTITTKDYDAPEPGPRHGTVTETWSNGRVKSTATFVRGIRNGEEKRYFEDGTLAFQGSWLFDLPIGEHVEWDDGVEKRTTYVGGLPEAVAADTKALERTRKLYDKAKYVRGSDVRKGLATCRAAKGDEYALTDAWMLHLWRTLKVNISNDDAWEMLAGVAPLVSGSEVMTMLREIDFEAGWGWPLPKWHGDLDKLVMTVYARDPAPIDAGWEKLTEPARSGVAYVRARFGKEVGNTLERQLAAVASNRQSIGPIWWPHDEAGPREVDPRAVPPEAARLRALFGTDAAWRAALIESLGTDDASSDAATHRLWIETATAAELVKHASDLHSADWERIVTQWRHDDAAGLTTIALGIEQASDARDHLVALAIAAHGAEGTVPPDALVELLDLPADDLSGYSEGDIRLAVTKRPLEKFPAGNEVFHRALRALPQDRIRRVIDRVLATTSHDRLRVGQYLYLVDDLDFVARYLDQVPGTWIYWMSGLGQAGARFLPLMIERFAKAKKVKAKRFLSAGINIALAYLGDFDAELDQYVDLTLDTERGFGVYLDHILCALPQARAEAILLAGFHTAFFAAFRRISVCGTAAVLRAAFGGLLAQPKVQAQLDTVITPTIEALPDGTNWWRWLHDSGATGNVKKECERQLRIGEFAD